MDELKFDSILRTGDYTTDVAKEKTETNFIASTTFSAGNIFPVAFFQNLKRKENPDGSTKFDQQIHQIDQKNNNSASTKNEKNQIQIQGQNKLTNPPLRSVVRKSNVLCFYDNQTNTMLTHNIEKVISEANQCLIGRDEAFRVSLLSVVMGEHSLLYGPPGTGKSYVGNCLLTMFKSETVNVFQTTFHTNIALEDICGPPNLKKLEEGINERVVKNMLPDCHLACLDEFFKASKASLSPLLTILNERQYKHGTELIRIPLWSCLTMANEVSNDTSQAALFDRILLRVLVDYLPSDEKWKVYCEKLKSVTELPSIDLENIQLIAPLAEKVVIQKEFYDNYISPIEQYTSNVDAEVTKELGAVYCDDRFTVEPGGLISDRRAKQLSKLLRIVAFTNNRNQVHIVDLYMCTYCLWKRRKDLEILAPWILNFVKKHIDYSHGSEDLKIIKDHVWLPENIKLKMIQRLTQEELDAHNKVSDLDAKKREEEAKQAFQIKEKELREREIRIRREEAEKEQRLREIDLERREKINKLNYEAQVANKNLEELNTLHNLFSEVCKLQSSNAQKEKELKIQEDKWREKEKISQQNKERAIRATIDLRKYVEDNEDSDENLIAKFVLDGARPDTKGGSYADSTVAHCCLKGKVKFLTELIRCGSIKDGNVWKTECRDGFSPIHLLLFSNGLSIDDRNFALKLVVGNMKQFGIDISQVRVTKCGSARRNGKSITLQNQNAEEMIKDIFSSGHAEVLLQTLNA